MNNDNLVDYTLYINDKKIAATNLAITPTYIGFTTKEYGTNICYVFKKYEGYMVYEYKYEFGWPGISCDLFVYKNRRGRFLYDNIDLWELTH